MSKIVADCHESGVGPGGSQVVQVTIGGRSVVGPAFEPAPSKASALQPPVREKLDPAEWEGQLEEEELYATLLERGPFSVRVFAYADLPVAAQRMKFGEEPVLFVSPDAWKSVMGVFISDCQQTLANNVMEEAIKAKVPWPLNMPLGYTS